jgi:hypothetical protein
MGAGGCEWHPVILLELAPGSHTEIIELEDAKHHPLDKGTVTIVVPNKSASEKIAIKQNGIAATCSIRIQELNPKLIDKLI